MYGQTEQGMDRYWADFRPQSISGEVGEAIF